MSSVLVRVRELLGSEYLRNVLTVFSGTAVAQLLPILLSPLMTRLYPPASYGALGVYQAVTGVAGMVVSSQYVSLILVQKEEEYAVNTMALGLLVSTVVCAIVALAMVLAFHPLCRVLRLDPPLKWLYLVPFSVGLAGLSSVLAMWANRKKRYRSLAIAGVATVGCALAVQLGIGFTSGGPEGLILGAVVGSTAGVIVLGVSLVREDRPLLAYVSWATVRLIARSRIDFSLYMTSNDFINVLTQQAPVFIFTRLIGTSMVGLLNLMRRVVDMPVSMIGSSVATVFRQRAAADYHQLGNCRQVFVNTGKLLAIIAILPLPVLVIAGPHLFAFVFGERWREAGEYAQILAPYLLFRFIVSTLSYTFVIALKQREDFFLQLLFAFTAISALILGYVVFGTPKAMLAAFALNNSIIYSVYLWRSYRHSKGAMM